MENDFKHTTPNWMRELEQLLIQDNEEVNFVTALDKIS